MHDETTAGSQQTPVASFDGAHALDAIVTEIGATYPLLAYTVQSGEDDETEAMNAAILAGLVAP